MILETKVTVMDQSMFAGEGGSDPSHWNITNVGYTFWNAQSIVIPILIYPLHKLPHPLSFPENDLCGLCRVLCLRILPRAETVKWGLFSGVKHEETPVRSSVESYIAFALQSKL